MNNQIYKLNRILMGQYYYKIFFKNKKDFKKLKNKKNKKRVFIKLIDLILI